MKRKMAVSGAVLCLAYGCASVSVPDSRGSKEAILLAGIEHVLHTLDADADGGSFDTIMLDPRTLEFEAPGSVVRGQTESDGSRSRIAAAIGAEVLTLGDGAECEGECQLGEADVAIAVGDPRWENEGGARLFVEAVTRAHPESPWPYDRTIMDLVLRRTADGSWQVLTEEMVLVTD